MNKKIVIVAISAAVLGIILVLATHLLKKSKEPLPYEAEITEFIPEIPEPKIEYLRIMVDSLEQMEGKIKRNQPVSVLLEDFGISKKQIHELTQKSKDVFNLRKIRAGNKFIAFFHSDSIHSLHYFVYEHSPLDYLAISFVDSVEVWTGKKDVDTVFTSFSGTIKTSLWNCMVDNGASPMLANELADIYAWSIDFFGLQEQDSLRVIYDEYFVNDVSIGIGKIHGAYFRHMNTDFWAIPFVQDSVPDYYDQDGKSLRKAFLKAPLRFSRISSRFSNSRMHPILKIRRPHHGVDYAAPIGTPVVAIGDGVVINKEYSGGAGNMVKIKHNSVYSTAYLHLGKYGEGIRNGAYVKQGQVIGFVGSTGLSTGPHLDFRFYKNGSAIDPLKVEAPPVDPVRPENIERFNTVRDVVMESVISGRKVAKIQMTGDSLVRVQ